MRTLLLFAFGAVSGLVFGYSIFRTHERIAVDFDQIGRRVSNGWTVITNYANQLVDSRTQVA